MKRSQASQPSANAYVRQFTVCWSKKYVPRFAVPGVALLAVAVVLLVLQFLIAACAVAVVGIILVSLAVHFLLWRYEVDETKLRKRFGPATLWKEIKRIQVTTDKKGNIDTAALYSDKRILLELSAAMEGFPALMDMARKKNIPVKKVKAISVKDYYKAK